MWHQCKHGTFLLTGCTGFKVQTLWLKQEANVCKSTLKDTFFYQKEATDCQRSPELHKHCELFWMFCLQCHFDPSAWPEYFWIYRDSHPDCVSGVCIRPEWNVWPSVSPDVCGCWNETSALWMTHTHKHTHLCCGLQGLWFIHTAGAHRHWSMECTCGQTAGSHEDQTLNGSPVVISSYALQLELDCIGRPIPLYVLCVCELYTEG